MKSLAAAFAATTLFSTISAQKTPGIVQWDIAKRQDGQKPNRLVRRAGTAVQETISNDQDLGGYFTSCTVGTPAQKFTLQLDTGSSDIWVPSSDAQACQQSRESEGCNLGSFDSSQSSTFNDFAPGEFNISYVDGTFSSGDYFTDVFSIGGATVNNMTMGLGLSTSIAYGLVGVGYQSNEALEGTERKDYPNLPVAMMNAGLINSVAYSLWLNDLDASTGNILFGGIDTDKFKDPLMRVDIQKDPTLSSFTVALTSVAATSSTGNDSLPSSQYPILAVLDSGTTLSYLPTDLATAIWDEVGAEMVNAEGLGKVAALPCSRASSSGSFVFGFGGPGGPQIAVSMSELVLDMSSGGQPPADSSRSQSSDQDTCLFGIQAFSDSPYLLGDSFLRSAYVVYDLVNNEIGLAQTDFNASGSNLVPFPSSGAAIPSSTVAPNQADISGSSTSGSSGFSASKGFQNAAGKPAAFDRSAVVVLLVSVFFTAMGGLFFVI